MTSYTNTRVTRGITVWRASLPVPARRSSVGPRGLLNPNRNPNTPLRRSRANPSLVDVDRLKNGLELLLTRIGAGRRAAHTDQKHERASWNEPETAQDRKAAT